MSNLISTGSLIRGTLVGTAPGYGWPKVTQVQGNPSGLILATFASGLAIDVAVAGGSIFMAVDKASKDWIALGSAAF